MSNETSELPLFPTSAPAVFRDPDAAARLFGDVLGGLAAVVDVDADQLPCPTPCAGFTVGELLAHVLGWLRFFAAALTDPSARSPRPDPDAVAAAVSAADGERASEVVGGALDDFRRAIAADVAGWTVTMSSARMAGDGVLGMALGEYIIHAWDLATATGQPYAAPDDAVEAALEFLRGMVAPEYRGPDTGFFDAEVPVADDAPPLDRLLGFAGRDPRWTPAG
ncbi:MAG: TIGR03086 family metal-binding protein [Acidimicrobiales bacterium]